MDDVRYFDEVYPVRPDRIGEYRRHSHITGMTDTAYTSWTTDRSTAEVAAHACSDAGGLSGRIVIFRVRVSVLDLERVFEGRADEDEYLIEGTVEGVEVSEDTVDYEYE